VYKKVLFPIDDFHFLFHRKNYHPLLFRLTSYTPSKSNLYFANSLTTVVNEPDLYRILTFHIPDLMSLFHGLGHTKGSVLAQNTGIRFVTKSIFKARSCKHLTQPSSWRTTPYRLSLFAYSIYF